MDPIFEYIKVGAAVVTAFTAIGGFYQIRKQLRSQFKIAKADLIFRLHKEWVDRHGSIYSKVGSLGPKRDLNLEVDFSPEEVTELVGYLDFFATMNVIIEEGLVSLHVIDAMFSYRFFTVLNATPSQQVLARDPAYWTDLRMLERRWREYRQAQNLEIPSGRAGAHDAVQATNNTTSTYEVVVKSER